MNGRLVATIGTALTTFLLVSAVLTGALASRIAFSAIVALPVGVLAGVAMAVATWARFWGDPDARPALLGGSAIGFALLVVAAVSYTVPPARAFVTAERALAFAGICAVAVFVLVSRNPDRFD
jgi:hypothetical protein